MGLVPIIVVIAILIVFMTVSGRRRTRDAQAMRSSLGPGADVVTTGGVYGRVDSVDQEQGTVDLEISDGVIVRFAAQAVARVISSGTDTDTDTATDGATDADESPVGDDEAPDTDAAGATATAKPSADAEPVAEPTGTTGPDRPADPVRDTTAESAVDEANGADPTPGPGRSRGAS